MFTDSLSAKEFPLRSVMLCLFGFLEIVDTVEILYEQRMFLIKDTFIKRTLLSPECVVFVSVNPFMRTPHYSGHFYMLQ